MRVGVPSSLVEAARQSSERGCESEVEASCVVCVWVWMFVFPGVIEDIPGAYVDPCTKLPTVPFSFSATIPIPI